MQGFERGEYKEINKGDDGMKCICQYCSNEFNVSPSRIKNGGGKYCSRSCQGKGNGSGGKVGEYNSGRSLKISQAFLDRTKDKYPQLFDDKFMRDHYITKEYSVKDLAMTIGCSDQAVKSALARLEIPIRTLNQANNTDRYLDKYRKDNNWQWKGGKKDYRGSNWGKQKRLARGMDNNTCQCCGLTSNDIGKNIPVHHIIPSRFSHNNALDNLILLCPSCHSIADMDFLRLINDNPTRNVLDAKILINKDITQVTYYFESEVAQ